MIRLAWEKPQTTDRIRLFDRPNTHANQVAAGMPVFSDESTVNVGASGQTHLNLRQDAG
jgi:hypothetical protein